MGTGTTSRTGRAWRSTSACTRRARMTSAAALTLALNLAGPAVAKRAAAKPKMCPVCKTMALTTKKTKTNTKMVKIGGKTYYCCAQCDMSTLGKSKGAAANGAKK